MIRVLLYFLLFSYANTEADELDVTLLGTGTPRPSIERFGSATLIEYKNDKYLFDVGRGTTIRLSQLGLSPSDIKHLFITHLHSDHITGYADFWLTGWIWQRDGQLNIYGPAGTSDFANNIHEAYSKDIQYRRAHTNLPVYTLRVLPNDIEEGVVFNTNEVKITAFRVDHGSVTDAFGYIFETRDYSIVISGDTTFSRNLIKYGKGADLLIHELAVIRSDLINTNKRLRKISEYHTSLEELISIVNQVNPKQTILNHLLLIGDEQSAVETKLRKLFGDRVTLGHDLMKISFQNEKVCVDTVCSPIKH